MDIDDGAAGPVMWTVPEVVRRIIERQPRDVDKVEEKRKESIRGLADEIRSRPNRELGADYWTSIDSQIRRTFFDGDPVGMAAFDQMLFDYISDENNDILDRSSSRAGQVGYSEFRDSLDYGRATFPYWPLDVEGPLTVALYDRWRPNSENRQGENYASLSTEMRDLLGSSTKRNASWWGSYFDNLRSNMGESNFRGSDGAQLKIARMRGLCADDQETALQVAMRSFYRDHGVDERNEVIEAIGEDPAEWASYIAVHGKEFDDDEETDEEVGTVDNEETEQVAQGPAEQVAEEEGSSQTEDEELLSPDDDGDWIDHLGALPPVDGPLHSPGSALPLPRNRIVYGGPGTGKSYMLNEDSNAFAPCDVTRVTFHPDYTNGNFVGSYRPVPVFQVDGVEFADQSGVPRKDVPGTPHILYEVTAGPFLEALVDAFNTLDEGRNHLLIIEEINRANPSAVLGDVFQLLDRKDDGFSRYPVRLNPEVMEYLRRKVTKANIGHEVGLPPNLYIWATMNTTDEGVFSVDSAFRRRWTMEHVSVNKDQSVVEGWQMPSEFTWLDGVSWNMFRTRINNAIIEKTHSREDQLLGPFFFSKAELEHPDRVKNKLLDYLHQSLLRHSPGHLFRPEYGHGAFSELMNDFDEKNVFVDIQFQDSASEDVEATEGGSPDGSAEEE